MSNFVALDFGERRVGVAVGDPEVQLVSPVETLPRRSDKAVIEALVTLARRHQATHFVLGLPCLLDGSETAMAKRVRSFEAKLRKQSDLPTIFVCETLTSRAARERIGKTGRIPRSNSKTPPPHRQVDAVAAQIIGEQFLTHTSTDADVANHRESEAQL